MDREVIRTWNFVADAANFIVDQANATNFGSRFPGETLRD
jgi:hypothetical protein